MAEELGKLDCCKGYKSFLLTKSIGDKDDINFDLVFNEGGNYFESGDNIRNAIALSHNAKKGEKRASDLCAIYNTLVNIITKSIWLDYDISSQIEKLKKDCENNVVKPKTCKEKLGSKYDEKVEECSKRKSEGELVRWSNSNCGCVVDESGVVAPTEEIRGCMDNKSTVNYDPEATINFGCVFEKVINLENKFCFCITDTCDEVGMCIQGKQIIKAKASSYESFEERWDRVRNAVLEATANITNPFNFRISTEKGFYGENPGDYIDDLVNALTILELKNYSLSVRGEGLPSKSDLVMQTKGGEYLGFFSGASMTSPMYKDFNLQTTSPIVNLRISKNLGGNIVNKSQIGSIQKIIKNRNYNLHDKVKNINIDMDGVISLQENITPLGLGKLLETKVIGLENLLK